MKFIHIILTVLLSVLDTSFAAEDQANHRKYITDPGVGMVEKNGLMVMVSLSPAVPKLNLKTDTTLTFHGQGHKPVSLKKVSMQWAMPSHDHKLKKIRPLPQREQGVFKAKSIFAMFGEYTLEIQGEFDGAEVSFAVPMWIGKPNEEKSNE